MPALLLAAYAGQCAWFIGTQSFTVDEPIDILSGLEEWRTGQYSGGLGWNDHPPLARLLCTLPAIAPKFQVINQPPGTPRAAPTGTRKLILPDPQSMAWHTRVPDALAGVLLGLLVWFAARSLYSVAAANFVLALFAFSPSLIAHFSLGATNDGVMTLMTFAAVFQLYRWRRRPSLGQTIVLGLALGGLLLAKSSSLPLFALAVCLILVLKPQKMSFHPKEWNWKPAAIVLGLAFLVVWAAYRFHVTKFSLAANSVRVTVTIPNRPDPIIVQPARAFRVMVPVPAYEFVQAAWFQLRHNREEAPGYLLGRSYWGGSLLYFPIAVLLKWPTVVLLLAGFAVVALARQRTKLPRDSALWAAFPVVLFVLALLANMDLGERYILPTYPFALLLCGTLWAMTKNSRTVFVLLLVAATALAADALRYAPDYLSYFTPLVRADSSYKLLSDSNVDWGEGLIALSNYQRQHPNEVIHLAYSGTVEPALYGVHAQPLMPDQRVSGTVIVSANYLSGQTLPDGPDGYHWVLQYPRVGILNHSLHVFEVPAEAGSR